MTQEILDETPQPLQKSLASLTELCRHFKTSRPTAMNWIALGCPVVTTADRSKGIPWEFDLDAVSEWLVEHEATKALVHQEKLEEQQEDASIIEARRKKIEAETQRIELRLAVERGELVRIEAVADIVENQYIALRQHLLTIPTKLAPLVVGYTDTKEIHTIIERYIHEALDCLVEEHVYESVKPIKNEELVHPPEQPHPLDLALGLETPSDAD